MSKIAKCPFCGEDDIIVMAGGGKTSVWYFAHCGECSASGPCRCTEDEAIAAWNRRALPSREEVAEAIRTAKPDGRSYWWSAADAMLALMKGETK